MKKSQQQKEPEEWFELIIQGLWIEKFPYLAFLANATERIFNKFVNAPLDFLDHTKLSSCLFRFEIYR